MTHLLVDTANGLRIVMNNARNFFNSDYSVQLVGTEDQCKAERKRLRAMEF